MTDRTHPDSGRIITSSDILLHDAETALLYEELRAAIDDGHESMTHSMPWLKSQPFGRRTKSWKPSLKPSAQAG